MAGKKKPRRSQRRDSSRKEALEGLRDVLDLTLTRVLEDDMDYDEAHTVLAHLRKELDALEGPAVKKSAAAKPPRHAGKRRTARH